MKKIILLLLILGCVVLFFLYKSNQTETITSNRILSETISGSINTDNPSQPPPKKGLLPNDLTGHWTLFLHYPDCTQGVDLDINTSGEIVSSNGSLLKDARLNILKDRTIYVNNSELSLSGILEPDYCYFKGMATIKGRKNPVPFSACKISERLKNK
ncbi:MAG: hypothetical protein JW920_02370 [Deltaproteobacteria bacterium]|nr:hypothetical protein [Deltaproteobacteria bacterium]